MKPFCPDPQVAETCTRIAAVAALLPGEIRELRVRALIPVGDDGWPAGGDGGGGKGGHSDRTGDTATRLLTQAENDREALLKALAAGRKPKVRVADPIAEALMNAIGNMFTAANELEKALGAIAKTKQKPPLDPSDLQFCQSCLRAKTPNGGTLLVDIIYRTRLCRRCYDWAGAHDGEWPPVAMLELRERLGKPLDSKQLAQFEGEKAS